MCVPRLEDRRRRGVVPGTRADAKPALALLGTALVACGGASEPLPPAAPVTPAPIVAWTPPAPSTPAPRPAPPPPPTRSTAAAKSPPKPPAPPAPKEPSVRCALHGRATFALGTEIQNAEGRPIARFSGAEAEVSVSELTLDANPRARIETGAPRGAFRIQGYVEAAKLPLEGATPIPIAAGHLWIGAHHAVKLIGVSSDKLKVEHAVALPLEQTFTAWTTCQNLTLDAGTPPGWSPPGDARGYALRVDALELYDAPGGSAVGVVYKAPAERAVLFFSTEQQDGWVHVERHGDIVIDAWARASKLSALPRGETMDQLARPANQRSPAHLALPKEPRVVRTTHDVVLRAHAKDTDPPIGVIGAGTETYVIDVVAGWASVMPKALDVVPLEGGAFWAKSADLGL